MASQKRYAADLDLYLYAENDTEAKKLLDKIVRFLRKQDDNEARAKKLVEIPFGSLSPREVEITT